MVTSSGGGNTASTSSSIASAAVAIPSQHAVTFIELVIPCIFYVMYYYLDIL